MDPATWGDVATWVTGALTAGSLFLGFSILRSDRRREERAQAKKFLVWFLFHPGDPNELVVSVWNTSESPIFVPMVSGKAVTGIPSGVVFPSPSGSLLHLRPGEESKWTIRNPDLAAADDIIVTFKDADGNHWTRELVSNRLYKRPDQGSAGGRLRRLVSRSAKD